MNWEKFSSRLLELDYRKDPRDRNPWIGRLSLYDLVDAIDYATDGSVFGKSFTRHEKPSQEDE